MIEQYSNWKTKDHPSKVSIIMNNVYHNTQFTQESFGLF